jgi:hypothetical protein
LFFRSFWFQENPSLSLRTDWIKGKYGLMVYLKRFMRDFDRLEAEWMIFPIGQGHSTYSIPNWVIDSLCGPGYTSRRDLVLEIDVGIFQEGHLGPESVKQLKKLKKAMAVH